MRCQALMASLGVLRECRPDHGDRHSHRFSPPFTNVTRSAWRRRLPVHRRSPTSYSNRNRPVELIGYRLLSQGTNMRLSHTDEVIE